MSRSRLILTLVLVGAVAAGVTLALVESDGTPDMSDLVAKIDALEKRIASLERTITQRMTALERGIAQGGGAPTPALEGEAQAAYGKINSLINTGKYVEAKTQMADFMQKYGATNVARQARRTSTELAVIGKDAPASWAIEKWYQGESDVDLASDQTTLLVFWEVWCPHCKREVPKLQALYDSLKGDGLQVVGLTKVNRSATDESVVDFIKEKNLAYPCAKETGELSAHFGVSGVPAAAVLKDGKVVWRGHPARLSESMLKAWL